MSRIGNCKVDNNGKIILLERDMSAQGMIFKDEDAFRERPTDPCYVPELTDTIYTKEDILNICNNQEEVAERVFREIDWQHPEAYLDELFHDEEIYECKHCGKTFDIYDGQNQRCPFCGELREE